ncbi:MAG: pilus assembly protein, partial [Candidatus Accumulibacter sp.]|nr:pilus assembly protein [Accumulibacter sp.]
MGKITVFSALGQPLRAEVEVFATREEISEMQAQLASPEEFRRAGVDYASTLLGIRFVIAKNPGGRSIIRLSSDRPINDPFIDLLLELNWATGRLVRDYTFLLDPPEFAAKVAASAAPAVVARPLASAGSARSGPPRRAVLPRPEPQPRAPSAGGGTHLVQRGETLSKIARETRPDGVSLDQMLVGLFRANEDAFDRGNMNRLRAGKILTIPEKSSLESISTNEARKVVIAQSSDWSAYRRKLAATAADAPAGEEAARQQTSGKITAKVEDSAAPLAEPKDQLKVSKSELPGGKTAPASRRSDEDLIAKEQALKEANERLAALERNVAELQRLVELKSQSLAELERQAAGQPAPTAPVAPTPAAGAPVPAAAAPAVAAMPMDKPAESRPVEAVPAVPKPEEARSEIKAEEPKPAAETPKPAEPPKPAEAPKAKVVVVTPPEEPGFLEGLLSSTPAMGAAGGILALLAAYWLARRRRQGGDRSLDTTSTLAPQSGDSLVANSVFRSTGGQSVDTSNSMAQTDFSQAGPGSIDTDEVDPVAEADVYMAYGRDAQAEEILLEARQKDPERHAIHLKLLEIYFGRRDVKPFDTLATELFNATGGLGVEWEKAAAMGQQLDPGNPLFGGTSQAAAAEQKPETVEAGPMYVDPSEKTIAVGRPADDDAMVVEPPYEKTMVVKRATPGEAQEDTVVRPAGLAEAGAADEVATERTVAPEPTDLADLDFDLGTGVGSDGAKQEAPAADDAFLETTLSFPNPEPGNALDFDLESSLPEALTVPHGGLDEAEPDAPPTPVEQVGALEETMLIAPGSHETSSQPGAGLDFEFDLGSEQPDEEAADAAAETQAVPLMEPDEMLDIGAAGVDSLEFDVKLTESTVLGEGMQHPSFDMSALSLDLEDDGRPAAADPVAGD